MSSTLQVIKSCQFHLHGREFLLGNLALHHVLPPPGRTYLQTPLMVHIYVAGEFPVGGEGITNGHTLVHDAAGLP